jgi:hypothetical protein
MHTSDPASFARWTFRIAGVYGLLVVAPMYFLEAKIGRDQPPAVTHPEFFYGFVGVTVAWQVLFLIIASDPQRLRPAMLAAVLEKAAYAIAVPILYLQHRVAPIVLAAAMIDALLGLSFVVAYLRTPGLRDNRAVNTAGA